MDRAPIEPGDNHGGVAARLSAAEILQAVLFQRTPLDEGLEAAFTDCRLAGRDRAFIRLLVATALRRRGQITVALETVLPHPMADQDPAVQVILSLGAAQLLFLETPGHAAVDTSVELAKGIGKRGQPGFVNAVLRRLVGDAPKFAAQQHAARLNTPDWLWTAWSNAFGVETCRAIAAAHLREPPLDLTARGDAAALAAELGADLLPSGTVRLTGGGMVTDIPGFEGGRWWAQDAAAALPVTLLGNVAGKRVIDLGAAPGGKTAQLASRGARVTAVDRSTKRMRRLHENMKRLHLDVDVVVADAKEWRPDAPADALVVDAPCSATGTIRRHPDIPWTKSAADLRNLRAVQSGMLANAVTMVKPGGEIIYCVCSLQPEEGIERVEAALLAGLAIQREAVTPSEVAGMGEVLTPAGDVQTLPCHLQDAGGMDGFYIARLRRLA